ncbi:ATP-dependent Clp protease adapter ClpS [Bartonella apis]|uniref:ATP-dependent Clp protease adapter ClpS n=1 Tax=Bartonella apis TaxID=1686310 RepID=UPI00243005B5|nr:ATP-dependent Clp protease adapter ClpS [Bartonella apis]
MERNVTVAKGNLEKLNGGHIGKEGVDHESFEAGVATKTLPKVKRPDFYRVLLLNDDYTPMDFVVFVLQKFFRKNREDATRIMLNVHHTGVGECGVYSYEVAETKVAQVMDCARENQHPLQCVMERK